MQGITFDADNKVHLPARFNVAVPFIDRHLGESEKAVVFDRVLLVAGEGTPKIGTPLSRFKMYRYPDFVVTPSAGTVRPLRTMSKSPGGAGGSASHKS